MAITVFFALALVTITLVHFTLMASAASFEVNSTADAVDITPGDGVCETAAGDCTLRAAIQEANALDGHDIISVPAGTYLLALAPDPNAVEPPEPVGFSCVLTLSGDTDGDLDITCPVTINGAGAGATIIEAGGPPIGAPVEQLALDRIFEIHQSAGNVTISSLTMRNGYHPEAGGALANSSLGRVRLENINVEESYATNAGGGIYHGEPIELECPECAGGASRLDLINTTISGNVAGNEGGGLYAQFGTLNVSGGSISNNQAASGAGLFSAGEQTEMGVPAATRLTGVTISQNVATGAGGGVYSDHEGSVTVTNATISGNTSFEYGGGIAAGSKTALTITGGTITGNVAVGEGGGLFAAAEGATTITGVQFTGNEAGKTLPSVEVPGEIVEGEGGGGGAFLGGMGPIEVTESNFIGNHATGEGGGIFIENNGSVSISHGEVANNSTHHGGGGIENAGRRVTLEQMSIHHNTATLDGGGIEGNGSGDFTIADSSIYANTAENGGGFANGADGATRIERTMIWNNRAIIGSSDDTGLGGGVYGLGDATAHYENVTITGNFAQIRGGGIYIDADADVHVDNSTISRNVAPDASGVGDEATAHNVPIYPSEAVIFRNTIVAGNLLSPNCNFALGSMGGNLEDGDSCHFRGTRDRVNARYLGLDAIADNGGPSMTMALRADSFAVDGGVGPCSATDARGVARPQNGRCDIGAFEFEGPFLPPDNEPPDTEYLTGPDQDTENTSAFTFTGTDNITPPEDLLYECRLIETDLTEPPEPVDPTEPLDPEFMWLGCPSPWQTELVEEGLFSFEVRAIDRAGNTDPTPDVYIFGGTDDLTPPDTFFTGTPANPSSGTTAVFGFSGTDNVTPAQWMEFECRLDSGDPELWLECLSPVAFSNLSSGRHTLEVRATDGMDNIDPTPATYTWTVGPPVNCEDANITLFADQDTYVDESLPQEILGIETEMVVRSGAGGFNARALVQFAIPTNLPSGCELQSAQLRLYSESNPGRTLVAAPITGSWSENSVSWLTQPGAGPEGVTTTSGNGYREWNVTAIVNGVMGGSIPNHGFMITEASEGDEAGVEHSFSTRHIILEPPETQAPQLILRFGGPEIPLPPAPVDADGETAVSCGQVITSSIRISNDLFNCPFDGLVIGAPNIVLDLNGHTIDGLNYLLTGQEEGLPVGIRNIGHDNVIIRNGTVQEFGSGVQLMAGATFNVVEDLVLKANAIAGVELWDADDGRHGNTIRDNRFVSNGESAVYLLSGTEHTVIENNVFDGNAGVTIHLIDARNIRIAGNTISGIVFDPTLGSDAGIVLESSSDNVIVDNYLAETGDGGIILELGSHRNLIEGNTATATGDAGIVISDSDGNQVLTNVAHLGSDSGISLDAANHTLVQNNDVRFNPSGVDLMDSSDSVVEGNDADYSNGTGIQIGGASYRNQIINNHANNTAGDGIGLEGDAADINGNPLPALGNLIESNVTNGNLSDGISIGGIGHTITGNTANSNAGFGITAEEDNTDGGGNTASDNGEPVQCVNVICGAGVPAPPPGLDVTAPDTFFVTTPSNGHGMLETVSFTFSGSDNIAPATALRFECRLDAPPDPVNPEPPNLEPPEPGDPDIIDPENWHECANPVTYYLLTTGDHTFEVRAIDPFQNVDLTPAVYTWSVTAMPPGADDHEPNTTIFQAPAAETTSTTATFRFGGTDNATEGPLLTFECSMDQDAYQACSSPATFTNLSEGPHSFSVRATDLADNTDPTPDLHLWTIVPTPPDTIAPDTTVGSGPDRTTVLTDATFTFTGEDPGADENAPAITFECSLDGAPFAACASPQSYTALAVGSHTFAVRAVDSSGNPDAGPATYQWAITPAAVDSVVGCGQVITQSIRVLNNLVDCLGDGLVVGAPNITIDMNGHTFDGTAPEFSAGIRNDGFDSVTIRNGVIQEFDYGVSLNPGTAFNIVEEMTFQLNITAAIQLANADDGVNGNIVRFNTIAGNDTGILATNGTQHAVIQENVISGTSGFSIYLVGGGAFQIIDNVISGSADGSIVLEGSSGNRLAGNIVTGASDPAVSVTLSSNFNVIEGNFFRASESGIELVDSSGNEILGNTATAMSDVGISLENAHDNLIIGNDLRFNGAGIELGGSSGNLIDSNNTSEGGSGISVGDSSLSNLIVNNIASANDGAGIEIHDQAAAGSGNLIDGNTTHNNIGNGIYVGNIGHVIANNAANYNGAYGIYAALATVAGGNIDAGGNTAIGNVGGGIDPVTLLALECFNVVCDGTPPLVSDPIKPETWITGTPGDDDEDNHFTSTSATFTFDGIDNATSVTFECRLDGVGLNGWLACSSPITYTGLSLGEHTFEVRAVDYLGNVDPSPASYSWAIEDEPSGVAPSVRIDSSPDGASLNTTATFTFSSNEENVYFECSIDGGAFVSCLPGVSYTGLVTGSHTFHVRAIDNESLVSDPVASHTWVITAAPVATQVSCGRVLTQSTLVTNDLTDCPNNGLVIGASGITVDLGGHTIDGIGQGIGILNNGHDNVVITNGSVQEFDYGVQLNPGTTRNSVSSLTFTMTEFAGIQLSDADGNVVRGISSTQSGTGVMLIAGSNNNVVFDGTINTSPLAGVTILNSQHNRVENNSVTSNSGAGVYLEGATNNQIIGNTLSGNSGVAVAITMLSHGTVVRDNTATGNSDGILISESNNNQVRGNDLHSNDSGIMLEMAHGNIIASNDVVISSGGIEVQDSNDNRISTNNVSANSGAGISIDGVSLNNDIVLNVASGNAGEGIAIGDPAPSGQGNLIERNLANNNSGNGIFAAGGHTLIGNQANFNDGWGLYAEQGSVDGGENYAVGNSEPEQCFGIVCIIGENPTAPDTFIIEKPSNPSNSRNASFTFAGIDDTTALIDLSFECRLDSQDPLAWVECEMPAIFQNLTPGEHTLEVRAVDLAENVDPTPATYTWVYQPLPPNVPPDTSIDFGPPVGTPLFEAFFKFSSNEPDVTFECSMDGGPWEACGNEPEMIEMNWFLAEYEFEEEQVGPHTFMVRAIDSDGNVDPTPAAQTWTILGSIAIITDGPAFIPGEGLEPAEGGETQDTFATFVFHANVADATFTCSLDFGVFQSCTSPLTYTNLAPGVHLLQIIAVDPEGLYAQQEATEYEWVVLPVDDTVPPDTTITSQPDDGSSDTTFTFTGTDNVTSPAAMLFECRLDSANEADWVECVSPFNLLTLYPDFAPGAHVFEVRANDNAEPLDPNSTLEGNVDPTPASYSWTSVADTTPPTVEITFFTPAPILEDEEIEVRFTGSDNATPNTELDPLLVFECVVDEGVDGAVFEPCASPHLLQGMLPGEHTFQVRTVDLAGNASVPDAHTFTVIGPPVTSVTSDVAQDSTTTATTATFEFVADQAGEMGVTYACALNGSNPVPCESPLILAGLGGGSYTFSVVATNEHGLVEVDPVEWSWSVDAPADTTPPDTMVLTGPPASTTAPTATFTFTSTELGSSFECGLVPLSPIDVINFSGCENPATFQDLLGGNQQFQVRAVDLFGNVDPTPATYDWTVIGEPLTTIISGPDDGTEATEATFEFVSSVAGSTFMCALDAPPFVACTSPVTYTGLSVGQHDFLVYAVVNGSLWDSEGADWNWDIEEPGQLQSIITAAPAATTPLTSATFTFESTMSNSTFECSIDGTPFITCISPITYNGLGLGEHTFAVRAIDELGSVEEIPASFTWVVIEPDTTPPQTTFGPTPPVATVLTEATFTFTSSEPFSTFECSLDGEAFSACVSPRLIDGLEIAPHTFEVRAIDRWGNVDPTPASFSWTVEADLTAPDTQIVSGPLEGDVIGDTVVAFSFEGTDDGTMPIDLRFECSFDGEPFSGCDSPRQYDALVSGEHTFQVRAIDAAGNIDATPASRTFEILDMEAPETSLDVVPEDPSEEGPATFEFSSNDPAATFACALNDGEFEPCASPHTAATTPGLHIFQVRAVDPSGNADATPEHHEWTVVSVAVPDTQITAGPATLTLNTTASFVFTADQPGVLEFECSLDGGPYESCESPHTIEGLTAAAHTLDVRAIDAAGKIDDTPAHYAWTVDALPDTTILGGPPASTAFNSATFTFISTEPGSTFQCSLNNAPFTACASPLTYSGLSQAGHAFRVRAVDVNGFFDDTPATYTWTVTPPPPPPTCGVVTLNANADAWIQQNSPSDNKGTDSTLKVQAKGPSDNFRVVVGFAMPTSIPAGCVLESATLQIYADSASSGRTLQAIALAGSWSENSVTWANQPATTGTAATKPASTGYVQWNVTGQMQVMYDGGPRNGFLIRDASEGGGGFEQQFFGREKGQNPPQLILRFTTAPPETMLQTVPESETMDTSATFMFSADQPATTFECSINGEPFAACTSPVEYNGLAVGDQEFEVQATNSWGETDPSPAVHEWTVEPPPDTTAPDTSVSTELTDPTASTSIILTLTSTEEGGTFECAIDGGDFSACGSPAEFTGLAVGEHTLLVRAIDAAGNIDESPDSYNWTIVPAPDTTVDSGPEATTFETSAAFTFSSDQSGVTFECSLDGGSFTACLSPATFLNLPVGNHSLDVRAEDGNGFADPSPARYEWTVTAADTTAPATTIDTATAPPDGDNTGNANFSFSANEEGATFECSLDGASFTACVSPQPYSGLAIGDHSFRVRATDATGNTDASPAVYSWTVDGVDPLPGDMDCSTVVTLIASGDAWIDQGSKTSNKGTDSVIKVMSKRNNALRGFVTFTLPEVPEGCEIDTATLQLYAASWKNGRTMQAIPVAGSWTETEVTWNNQPSTGGPAATTSSGSGNRSWNVSSQVQAMYDTGVNHGFMIRDSVETNDHEQQFNAREKGQNQPKLIIRFKPSDTTPPQTVIDSKPDSTTSDTTATFTFSGTDAVTDDEDLTFECRLDSDPWAPCTSPMTYDGLDVGDYKFEARAIDEKENVDKTPARFRWTVEPPPDTTAPETSIDSGPSSTTESTGAVFTFSSSEPGSTFRCSVDGGDYVDCWSPWELAGLGTGEHTFRVRAFDAAGNGDESSSGYTWTVVAPADTTPPGVWFNSVPPDGDTNTTASFTFAADETVTFTCWLDGAEVDCSGSYSGLSTGYHEFEVVATDGAGNSNSAVYGWTIAEPADVTPPETFIDATPVDGDTTGTASFTFSADEPATFECRIDGGSWTDCSSAFIEYTGIAPGLHTFEVRAVDAAGNPDPAPAFYSWTVATL